MALKISPGRWGKTTLKGAGNDVGFGRRGLLEKGSFQKSPCYRDSREFRDSRDFREPPDCGKRRRIQPFSRDFREFRDFRDSSSEKTPFVMTPFSGPDDETSSGLCHSFTFSGDIPSVNGEIVL